MSVCMCNCMYSIYSLCSSISQQLKAGASTEEKEAFLRPVEAMKYVPLIT